MGSIAPSARPVAVRRINSSGHVDRIERLPIRAPIGATTLDEHSRPSVLILTRANPHAAQKNMTAIDDG
jgi:hypothetical protein